MTISIMRNLTRRALLPAVFFALAGAAALLPAQQPEPPPPPDRLTFCSYNLKNWLTMDRFDAEVLQIQPAAPKPEPEKLRVVQILTAIRPDILGVCEIGDSDDLAELQMRLKENGIDLPYTELAHGSDTTRRLALLSRFPIKARNSRTELKYELGGQPMFHQRGILDATIAITPAFELRCLGVHLKSKREVAEADQAEMRRNEARLLRLHMDAILNDQPDAALLAYGDFNEHRNEPAIADIIGSPRTSPAAMLDVLLRDRQGEVWTHFWDAADTYSRLDYCFASRLLRPHIDTKQSFIYSAPDFHKASDHRPLVLKISPVPLVK